MFDNMSEEYRRAMGLGPPGNDPDEPKADAPEPADMNTLLRAAAKSGSAVGPVVGDAAIALVKGPPQSEPVDGTAFNRAVKRLARPAGSFGAAVNDSHERRTIVNVTSRPIRTHRKE